MRRACWHTLWDGSSRPWLHMRTCDVAPHRRLDLLSRLTHHVWPNDRHSRSHRCPWFGTVARTQIRQQMRRRARPRWPGALPQVCACACTRPPAFLPLSTSTLAGAHTCIARSVGHGACTCGAWLLATRRHEPPGSTLQHLLQVYVQHDCTCRMCVCAAVAYSKPSTGTQLHACFRGRGGLPCPHPPAQAVRGQRNAAAVSRQGGHESTECGPQRQQQRRQEHALSRRGRRQCAW